MTKLIDITGKAVAGEWGTDDESGNGVPVLRTTNFTNEGIVDLRNVVTRTITKKNIQEKYLRAGDIILEKSGGSDKQPVGRVIYYDGPENTYLFNNFTGLLRVKESDVWCPRYVFYSLYANYIKGGTRKYENKTTGLHNLKTDAYVSGFEVPDVEYEIQKTICGYLDRVATIIRLRKQELQMLDDLVKSRFVELFGDFKTNPKGWPVVGFEEIALLDCNMTTDYERYSDYPHIGIDCIEKDTGIIQGYRTVAEDGVISGKCLFTKSHLIYSKIRPNLNKVAIPDFEGLCSADAYPILPIADKCDRVFLAYNMRSAFFLDYILRFANRTNLPKVNRREIAGFQTPLPPLALQKEFSRFVERADKSKLAIQQSLEKLEILRKSLMQHYFG